MKKLTLCIMTTFMLLSIIPTQLKAGAESAKITITDPNTPEATEAKALVARLYEIKAMDIAKMNSMEKKQLRTEVRSIKSHLKTLSGGVYLSAGAIIIILLIIILLL